MSNMESKLFKQPEQTSEIVQEKLDLSKLVEMEKETLNQITEKEGNASENRTEQAKKKKIKLLALAAVTMGLLRIFAPDATSAGEISKDLSGGEKKLEELQKQAQELEEKINQEKARLNQETWEQRKERRLQEFSGHLASLGVEGLSLGKARSNYRTGDNWGLYDKNGYVADLNSAISKRVSDKGLAGGYTQEEFLAEVAEVLSRKGIGIEKRVPVFEIDKESRALLNNWGGKIEGNVLDLGPGFKKITIDPKVKKISIKSFDDKSIFVGIEEEDGLKKATIYTKK